MKRRTKQETKQDVFEFPADQNELLSQIRQREVCLWKVPSDFYSRYGINENDLLIIHRTIQKDENQLTVWNIQHNKTCNIGFAYDNFGDISIQRSDDIIRYKRRNVTFIGVVVGVIKPFDAQNLSNLQPEKSDEIRAVCGKCKKEINGTPGFIKAQGWELEESETVCLNCDLFGRQK